MLSMSYNSTVTLRRAISETLADGTYSNSYEDQEVKASFQPVSASNAAKYGRTEGEILANLYLPKRDDEGEDVQVSLDDKVLVGADSWLVVQPPMPDAYNNGCIRCLIRLEQ